MPEAGSGQGKFVRRAVTRAEPVPERLICLKHTGASLKGAA